MSKFHKILVLGNTGNGKSTFCNYILDYPEKKCKESDDTASCTFEVNGYVANPNSKNKDIYMIDTPGLSDGLGRDQEIIDKIRSELKNKHCNGIKSIIIIENMNEQRISAEAQRQITIYSKMFPNPEFWYHVGIVFSFCYESFTEKQFLTYQKQKINKYLPSLGELVEKLNKEMNEQLPPEKQIQTPNIFQCFFTDCGEVFPPQTHERTDNQISNLLSWTRQQDYLDFDKNDFEAVFADCKKKEKIEEPKREYFPEVISKDEVKETYKYFIRYRVTDFYDNTTEIPEKDPFKTEIFYIKQEKYSVDGGTEEEKSEEKDEKGLSKIIIKKKKIWKLKKVKYDENHKEIEVLSDEPIGSDYDPPKLDVCPWDESKTKREKKDDPHYVLETIREYKDSPNAVQAYFDEIRKLSVGKKILFIGFNIVHFLSGLFHLILYGISKLFKRKQEWVITGRKVAHVKLEKITKFNKLGEKFEGNWEIVDTIEGPWIEYEKPYRKN